MHITPQVENAMLCDHASGRCSATGSGHALGAMQARVIAATPSSWQDAVVVEARQDGWMILALVHSDEVVSVWHHTSLESSAPTGQPVALHRLYRALAIGDQRISVLTV